MEGVDMVVVENREVREREVVEVGIGRKEKDVLS